MSVFGGYCGRARFFPTPVPDAGMHMQEFSEARERSENVFAVQSALQYTWTTTLRFEESCAFTNKDKNRPSHEKKRGEGFHGVKLEATLASSHCELFLDSS